MQAGSESTIPNPDIHRHVTAWLRRVEAEEGVRILYAAESGSRAWGFPSADSDYDVRFIYAHERDWYTSLHEARDVIERPLDERLVDLVGWDVRKALRLLLRSNPALHEWLVSPIIYVDDGQFRRLAGELFVAHASQRALAHHYFSIATTAWREMAGRTEVPLKKYFYLMRALLSLQWVIGEDSLPPMSMPGLLLGMELPDEVRAELDALTVLKRSTSELGRGAPRAALNAWVHERLAALDPASYVLREAAHDPASMVAADRLFRVTVGL